MAHQFLRPVFLGWVVKFSATLGDWASSSAYIVDYNSEGNNKAERQKFYCFKKILYNSYFSGWFVLEEKNASGPYSRTMYTV